MFCSFFINKNQSCVISSFELKINAYIYFFLESVHGRYCSVRITGLCSLGRWRSLPSGVACRPSCCHLMLYDWCTDCPAPGATWGRGSSANVVILKAHLNIDLGSAICRADVLPFSHLLNHRIRDRAHSLEVLVHWLACETSSTWGRNLKGRQEVFTQKKREKGHSRKKNGGKDWATPRKQTPVTQCA